MHAIVRTGGFQYLIQEGDRIAVPLLDAEPGAAVTLGDVLLLRTANETLVGMPRVEGAQAEAKVIGHARQPKITVYKFIKRENYRRKKGHRQVLTELEVTKIGLTS